MGFSDLLKKMFGSKADRDLKEIRPILNKALAAYEKIDKMSDDELRAEAQRIKKAIADRIAADEAKKKELRGKLEDMTLSPDEKERIATEVDKLTKKIDGIIETVLMEVLPEAFAVIRSTARRFKENATIKVLASDADRELSTKADFVTIEGDYAIWKNTWLAGGNPITWDMVHYEVQLMPHVHKPQPCMATLAAH